MECVKGSDGERESETLEICIFLCSLFSSQLLKYIPSCSFFTEERVVK
jgi:hypothetical protein